MFSPDAPFPRGFIDGFRLHELFDHLEGSFWLVSRHHVSSIVDFQERQILELFAISNDFRLLPFG